MQQSLEGGFDARTQENLQPHERFFFQMTSDIKITSECFPHTPVVDPGEGRGGALLLDQTEARRAEKIFLETGLPLISGSGPPPSENLDPPLHTTCT